MKPKVRFRALQPDSWWRCDLTFPDGWLVSFIRETTDDAYECCMNHAVQEGRVPVEWAQ